MSSRLRVAASQATSILSWLCSNCCISCRAQITLCAGHLLLQLLQCPDSCSSCNSNSGIVSTGRMLGYPQQRCSLSFNVNDASGSGTTACNTVAGSADVAASVGLKARPDVTQQQTRARAGASSSCLGT